VAPAAGAIAGGLAPGQRWSAVPDYAGESEERIGRIRACENSAPRGEPYPEVAEKHVVEASEPWSGPSCKRSDSSPLFFANPGNSKMPVYGRTQIKFFRS